MKYILILLLLVGCNNNDSTIPDNIRVVIHPSSLDVPYDEPLEFWIEIFNHNDYDITVKIDSVYYIEGTTDITTAPTWYATAKPAIPDDIMTHVHISPEINYSGLDDIVMVYIITINRLDRTSVTTIKTPMRGSKDLLQVQ